MTINKEILLLNKYVRYNLYKDVIVNGDTFKLIGWRYVDSHKKGLIIEGEKELIKYDKIKRYWDGIIRIFASEDHIKNHTYDWISYPLNIKCVNIKNEIKINK